MQKSSELLYHEIIYTSYDQPYWFDFNFQNIDKLVFTPGLGGEDYYTNYRGNHIMIDNINVTVPEPITLSLLAMGSAVVLRRR